MEQTAHRLAAIMSSDIAGFARMMERDETGTLELLKTQNKLVRETVAAYEGRVIKTVGDAFLCEFSSTVSAVKCAVEIQETVGVHNEAEPRQPLRLRIGVHLGDIYFLDDDAVGDGITVVTRLQRVAHPGRVCISQDVYHLVAQKVPFGIARLGTVRLRDLDREIDAYEIAVSSHAEQRLPGDELDEDPDTLRPEQEPREARRRGEDGPSDPGRTGRRSPGRVLADNLKSPEYADFNELKSLVLQEIRKAGRRVSIEEVRGQLPERSSGLDRALERLADKGFLTRTGADSGSAAGDPAGHRRGPDRRGPDHRGAVPRKRRARREDYDDDDDDRPERNDSDGAWDIALRQPPPSSSGYDPLVEDYRDHAAKIAEKEKAGFRGHLVPFIGVNAGTFMIWLMTTPGGFPWFMIPLLAWGIGLASHYAGVRDRVRESRELDHSEGLTREQLRIYRKLAKNRRAWNGHLVSNVATGIFLVMLNLITSPGFMWSLFPVGFMAIGLLTHLPGYTARERRLTKRLRALGARIGGALGGSRSTETSPDVAHRVPADGPGADAEQIRRRLLAAITALPSGSPLDGDFEPVLDNYVDQIKLLDQKNREIDEIIRSIPRAELQRDLVTLQKRREEASSEKVIAEYDRSILQIRKQQTSYEELKNEQEILRLRLSSSLNQLKQMEIDVARMRSMSSAQEPISVSMIRDKSRELSQYLDDLSAGHQELE